MYLPLSGTGSMLCIPSSPKGRPYPLGGPGKTKGIAAYPTLCGRGLILFSHLASLVPRRPRHDSGDWGVSAAVREWLDLVHT